MKSGSLERSMRWKNVTAYIGGVQYSRKTRMDVFRTVIMFWILLSGIARYILFLTLLLVRFNDAKIS